MYGLRRSNLLKLRIFQSRIGVKIGFLIEFALRILNLKKSHQVFDGFLDGLNLHSRSSIFRNRFDVVSGVASPEIGNGFDVVSGVASPDIVTFRTDSTSWMELHHQTLWRSVRIFILRNRKRIRRREWSCITRNRDVPYGFF